jgi:predicted N-acetyltransferase YhbS
MMTDLLVHLLKLPSFEPLRHQAEQTGIHIRRANPWELSLVRSFIEKEFAIGWADETSVGFVRQPVSVFIATQQGTIVGFAAYECTRRGFLGPMGVAAAIQKKGIGTALLVAALHGLAEMGYVYGIIGGAGPVEFYQRAVGATVIPDSAPGIYTDLLKRP